MSSCRRPWCCAKPPAARRTGGRHGRGADAGCGTADRRTSHSGRRNHPYRIHDMRMPRHTQPDRTADDTSRPHIVRINPRVATYTTQQIDQPKPIRPATGSSLVCPDIHNPTNPAPQPSTTPSIRTPRMSRHTQPDKPANHRSSLPDNTCVTHVKAYATRQTQFPGHLPRHHSAHHACPDKHNATDRTVRGPTHTTTAGRNRMKVPGNDKGHRVRIHSHTAGSGGTDRNTERCKGALCED